MVGVFGGAAGVLFNKSLLIAQRLGQRQQRIPRWMLPGIAGLAGGLLGWWMPERCGGGQAVAERLLGGTMIAGLTALVVLFAAKLLFTAIGYGSGAPGGIFAPMLVLGALLGAMFGRATAAMLPATTGEAQVLAVLGMAAVFTGSVRAPLTGIVLISEMTGGYTLLFPICIASLAAYLVAEALHDHPIYEALLEADLERSGFGTSRPEPRSMYIGVQLGSRVAGKRIAKPRCLGGV